MTVFPLKPKHLRLRKESSLLGKTLFSTINIDLSGKIAKHLSVERKTQSPGLNFIKSSLDRI